MDHCRRGKLTERGLQVGPSSVSVTAAEHQLQGPARLAQELLNSCRLAPANGSAHTECHGLGWPASDHHRWIGPVATVSELRRRAAAGVTCYRPP